MGPAGISSPCLHALMRQEVPVSWHSSGGWFLGYTAGLGHKNVELRTAQYRASFDPAHCLALARGVVRAKVLNARTLLRRNWRDGPAPEPLLKELARCARLTARTSALETLLGVEGEAGHLYFRHFGALLNRDGEGWSFDFNGRNRRPPLDPVNALLSFGYAVLTRLMTITLVTVGFDPYRGFYHQPRYGRPALALDLMEPFRPLIVDSAVLTVINNGEVRGGDFRAGLGGVMLGDRGRKAFLSAMERRLEQEVRHPLFDYRLSYRRLLELQARLLERHLLGELPEYPNFTTR